MIRFFRQVAVFIIIPGLAVGCSSAQAPDSKPRSWRVAPDGSADFTTIQASVDAASPGDTIFVTAGIYRGTGNRDIELRGKAIALRGAGPDSTIIECGGAPGDPHRGFWVHQREGRGTLIEGFSVTGGYVEGPLPMNYGGGLLCDDASPTVRFCRFVRNQSSHFGGGIICHDGASPLFDQVEIIENFAENNGGGLGCKQGSHPVLKEVVIANNTARRGGGFWCLNAAADLERVTIVGNRGTESTGGIWSSLAEIRISRSIIAFSPVGEALSCSSGSPKLRLGCCDIYGNQGGDEIPGCAVDDGGNFSADPLFCDPVGGDFRLRADSPCLGEGSPCGAIGALPICAETGGSH